MESQVDYDFFIEWNRRLLNFVGIWPEKKTKFKSKCKFIAAAFMMIYFIILPQTADLFFIWTEIELVVENLSTANICICTALLKLIVFWRNSDELLPLITYMKEDWEKLKSKTQIMTMQDVGRFCRSMTIRMVTLTQVMVLTFLLLQCYLNASGFYPSKRLPYRSYFLYNVLQSPIYEITWISQYLTAATAAVSYVGVDVFIGITILHICGQLTILQYELIHLVDPVVKGKKNAIDLVREKLKFITRRHDHLNRLAGTIDNIFNLMFLVQMVSLSIQLCFQGFEMYRAITSQKGATFFKLFFLFLFMNSLILLFYVYCYVGEQLNRKTEALRCAAFECEWYNLPSNEIKALSFILLRTKNPPRISAGKFCFFTLVTFCEVLKRSVGYLSVLLTIRET